MSHQSVSLRLLLMLRRQRRRRRTCLDAAIRIRLFKGLLTSIHCVAKILPRPKLEFLTNDLILYYEIFNDYSPGFFRNYIITNQING